MRLFLQPQRWLLQRALTSSRAPRACDDARLQQASLGPRLADVAEKRLLAQRNGDGPPLSRAYARRSPVPERSFPTQSGRRAASTGPGARTPHLCVGWGRIIGIARRPSTTSASRASTAHGASWSRRWPTSSSPAACSTTGSRVRCDDCAHEYLLALACRCRCFCPICHAECLAIWTQRLDPTLLEPVPHRQVVLSIPKRLRAYSLYRRRLLGEIVRVAARTVTAAIGSLIGERELAVGIVACLQTHGSGANWHLHLHLLITDGGLRPNGTLVSWPAHDTARLTEAFRREVLRLFVRLALFDEDQAAGMLTSPHSEFHVHSAVWVPEEDRAFATRLARYCARNPIALERLTEDRTAKAVTYRSDKSRRPRYTRVVVAQHYS